WPEKCRRDASLASAAAAHQHEVVRMRIIEHGSCTLVEQVGIDPVRSQQRHAMLPGRPLELEASEFLRKLVHLLGEILLGLETMGPGIGIDAEIADEQRGCDIE